jgi:hypothetical protein
MKAVEWLVDQMRQRKEQGLTLSFYDLEMFAEKAKEMEKEQMEITWNNAIDAQLKDKWDSYDDFHKTTFKSE